MYQHEQPSRIAVELAQFRAYRRGLRHRRRRVTASSSPTATAIEPAFRARLVEAMRPTDWELEAGATADAADAYIRRAAQGRSEAA